MLTPTQLVSNGDLLIIIINKTNIISRRRRRSTSIEFNTYHWRRCQYWGVFVAEWAQLHSQAVSTVYDSHVYVIIHCFSSHTSTADEQYMREHVAEAHLRWFPYVCAVCNARYTSVRQCMTHLSTIHKVRVCVCVWHNLCFQIHSHEYNFEPDVRLSTELNNLVPMACIQSASVQIIITVNNSYNE
jgi:hypothetical protein